MRLLAKTLMFWQVYTKTHSFIDFLISQAVGKYLSMLKFYIYYLSWVAFDLRFQKDSFTFTTLFSESVIEAYSRVAGLHLFFHFLSPPPVFLQPAVTGYLEAQ